MEWLLQRPLTNWDTLIWMLILSITVTFLVDWLDRKWK
jgi:hypothetical protein